MFDNFRVFETQFCGTQVVVETGKMCGLSNGSCLIKYGETTVLCNVTASAKPRDGIDFFPLSVDFEEKQYAVGKIPGSFMKREGKPSEKSILASRMVDRPIRPLFPKDMRNDVSVVMTVMSADEDHSPEIAGMLGTSIALAVSDIPWNGPVAGISVGYCDGKVVLNPNSAERDSSKMNVTVVGTSEKIVMIEAGADEVSEAIILVGIEAAHKEIKKTIEFINDIAKEIGKPKFTFESQEVDPEMFEKIKDFATDKIKFALDTDDKNIREERLSPVVDEIHAQFDTLYEDKIQMIDECIYKLQKFIVRRWLLDEGKRVDGRKMDEIRPLDAQIDLIPRVHGSGMFTRGQTQVLTIATLGSMSDAQVLDGLDGVTEKRYMHQYNFPSYSVGETRPSRGPGRREIGHGALAEKALDPVIPPVDEFPYALRLVSEVLSSNGSTSQGAICGSTLALMAAGVPIKAPVAGISCGLVTEGERFMTMVDIQGLEDFFGDMDFKVGGTHNGITAIQMDIKIDGLTMEIISEALEKTRKARLHILDNVMLKCIPASRTEVSDYAPKVAVIKIAVEKIREVIGAGGKVVQKLCADYDCKIDIQEDGSVFVSAMDGENARKTIDAIKAIIFEPVIGETYKGKVTRIMQFGAFVEIAPGKEGLVHISKLDTRRIDKVEDVVKIGDEISVKVIEIDAQGRVNLSKKDARV